VITFKSESRFLSTVRTSHLNVHFSLVFCLLNQQQVVVYPCYSFLADCCFCVTFCACIIYCLLICWQRNVIWHITARQFCRIHIIYRKLILPVGMCLLL